MGWSLFRVKCVFRCFVIKPNINAMEIRGFVFFYQERWERKLIFCLIRSGLSEKIMPGPLTIKSACDMNVRRLDWVYRFCFFFCLSVFAEIWRVTSSTSKTVWKFQKVLTVFVFENFDIFQMFFFRGLCFLDKVGFLDVVFLNFTLKF